MVSKVCRGLTAAAAIVMGLGALGEPLKIGAVDLPRLLREAPQTRAVLAKVEQDHLPRRRSIAVLEDDLRRKTEHLQRDGAVMSVEARAALEREIREMQRKLKQQQELYGESLSIRRYEDLMRLQAELMQEAREIAGRAGFDLVLPNALYAAPEYDVTDLVLTELGHRFALGRSALPRSEPPAAGHAPLEARR